MPEDVGGTPFPDGWEPDDDRGVSDEEFASAVFDEAFVQAATVHEPTAVERLLAAAQARAEASETEARRAHASGEHYTPEETGLGQDPGDDEFDDTYVFHDGHGLFGGYAKQVRWHRPVAWLLAVVMGIGMVALVFTAVYRGASSSIRDQAPAPASTGLEQGSAVAPSVSADTRRPAVSAVPRSP